MFHKYSSLRKLKGVLADTIQRSEYALGIRAIYDREVIFALDVEHLNFELPAFPVNAEAIWNWINEQLLGSPGQETFVYEINLDGEDREDRVMEKLVEIGEGTGMTAWTFDLESEERKTYSLRFIVITIPDKRQAKEFRVKFHGKNILP